jgi:sugar (pentulose or hexulose) kinase
VLPTWPATKLLWLRRHRPELWRQAASFLLLKDYVAWRLTGVAAADCSVATFSFFFDIYHRCYWQDMLDAVGIRKDQLPALLEPCTELGTLCPAAAEATGLSPSVRVNCGTLDHFAGMIGTGNVTPGGVTLSTGTVMALATMAREADGPRRRGIAMHYGFLPDTRVMLPVAESGGACLEWFRNACMPQVTYDRLNAVLAARTQPNGIVFLPYLVGTNAPEFDQAASGLFWGLRAEHDAFDMAAAVMEGVAFLLRKNCEAIRRAGTDIRYIAATGGGAASPVWCQMQSDITGLPVAVPRDREAACLGAAMAAAVGAGAYGSYSQAAEAAVSMERQFTPRDIPAYRQKYRRFTALYDAALLAADL